MYSPRLQYIAPAPVVSQSTPPKQKRETFVSLSSSTVMVEVSCTVPFYQFFVTEGHNLACLSVYINIFKHFIGRQVSMFYLAGDVRPSPYTFKQYPHFMLCIVKGGVDFCKVQIIQKVSMLKVFGS